MPNLKKLIFDVTKYGLPRYVELVLTDVFVAVLIGAIISRLLHL